VPPRSAAPRPSFWHRDLPRHRRPHGQAHPPCVKAGEHYALAPASSGGHALLSSRRRWCHNHRCWLSRSRRPRLPHRQARRRRLHMPCLFQLRRSQLQNRPRPRLTTYRAGAACARTSSTPPPPPASRSTAPPTKCSIECQQGREGLVTHHGRMQGNYTHSDTQRKHNLDRTWLIPAHDANTACCS
jgi:hypothetical protein